MELKKNIKIGMIMEEWKYKDKATLNQLIKEAEQKAPELKDQYKFVKQKVSPGPTQGCVTLFRHYKLKE